MLRKDMDDLDANGKKGDWCFLQHQRYIALRYGSGGVLETTVLPIHKAGTEEKQSLVWEWNGNEEKPTLSPSILVYANAGWTAGWHGFLRDGLLLDA